MSTLQSIHSLTYGSLGHFKLWAIMNKIVIKIQVQVIF